MRFVDLTVVSQEKCASYYIPGLITDGTLCTGTDNGKVSICSGDSGGPLVLPTTGRLIGVTSFSSTDGCQSGAPSGFARVSHYLDWIQQITRIVA